MMLERKEYPRPQLRRDDWIPLNGIWQFEFDDENDGLKRRLFEGKQTLRAEINVPFTYQYPASGVGDQTHHEVMWYQRRLTLTEGQLKRRALLCFNGVDFRCDVWVNGVHALSHTGGFSPFSADITDLLAEENTLTVRCRDPLDPTIPRGKQSWRNEGFGCWYVPNSGIWQSVWLEFFDGDCLAQYSAIPDIDTCSFGGELVTLHGIADRAKLTVSYGGRTVKTQSFGLDGKYTRYRVRLMDLDFVDENFWWTPETPNLFYLDIELLKGDRVLDVTHTRFGMRKIGVNGAGEICLNNRPYYQRLILDQGYFAESGLTPPSAEALRRDIELSVAMGFNGARKHQKFEDPYYYYYADEIGFLTWCEMPSAYNFNGDEQRYLTEEWQQIVLQARNFTSVVCYVPLNESWGVRKMLTDADQQNFARAMYYITKSQDGSRLVSTNDGWENSDATDIVSVHDYAYDSRDFAEKYRPETLDRVYPSTRKLMAEGCAYRNQPVLFTEFGGIAMQTDGKNGSWGYNSGAKDCEEFYRRYGDLTKGLRAMWFQGFCYTQLTDVQQEVNGLLNERHEPKFDAERIRRLTDPE